MLKLNDNGDLVDYDFTPEEVVYTAAELRAVGLVRGEVGISREDARLIEQLINAAAPRPKGIWDGVAVRLRTAIGEKL